MNTKFEPLKRRASSDHRQPHDVEDIIYVLGNNADIVTAIKNAGHSVKKYLKEESQGLLMNKALLEAISSALSFDSGGDRPEIIKSLIRKIVEIA